MLTGREELLDALSTLGTLFQERGHAYDIVLIGGGALMLAGLIERPTKDLDVLARMEVDELLPADTRVFGTLTVRIASRVDQVAFKLYATVDQGPRSKHLADLRQLAPTASELIAAADWCRTHDPSEGFRTSLVEALQAFGVDDYA